MSERYPTYKESGIEWLGEVPAHWSLSKLKHASEVNPRKGCSDYEKDSDELVTFLPMENVSEDGHIETSTQKPISELWKGYTYFEEGDAIVAKITPCFENGKAAHLSELGSPIGFGSTEFHVLRPRKGVSDGRFLYYLVFSHVFRETGEAFMTGAAGQKRIPTQFVEEFELALPPLEEQRTIAAYLDRKTAQIDTLIAKKQRLIDLLREQRTADINRAVTQGLDPDAPMQNSGIEWLGEVPAHWDTTRAKLVADIFVPQRNKPRLNQEGDGLPWITTEDLQSSSVSRSRNDHFVSSEDAQDSGSKSIPPGSVIASCVGRFGITAVNTVEVIINQQLQAYVPRKIDSWYLRYLVMLSRPYFEQVATAATLPYVNQENFGNLPVLLPPVREQKSIVQHIDQKASEINSLIRRESQIIDKLRELRTSLISEVVTGKIDVRSEVREPHAIAAPVRATQDIAP